MSQQTNWVPTSVDLEKPSAARAYDYVLGREPQLPGRPRVRRAVCGCSRSAKRFAIMNRAFMRRAVLFLVDSGIRQFLDLGSGIPTVGNVHEIAQEAAPTPRVVYVDNDPVAVAAQPADPGAATRTRRWSQADITRPRLVLHDPDTGSCSTSTSRSGCSRSPSGTTSSTTQDPVGVFASYRDALAPGSYLALTHLTVDFGRGPNDSVTEMMKQIAEQRRSRRHTRPGAPAVRRLRTASSRAW